MKEFIDKLIGRLEEEKKEAQRDGSFSFAMGFKVAISIINELAKEHINTSTDTSSGWIPCSERLPNDCTKRYLVQKTTGTMDVLGYTKDAYELDKYDFAEYKGKNKPIFYNYHSTHGFIEWECVAWQPLPALYKEIN